MTFILALTATLAGLLMLAYAGDKLVEGASALAQRFKVSDVFIGIVIIGFGTSLPEVLATASAAWGGQNDIALGNVIGSNIANVGLILGVAFLLTQRKTSLKANRRDYFSMCASLLFFTFLLLSIGQLTLVTGVLLLALMVGYLLFSLSASKSAFQPKATTQKSLLLISIFTLGGLIGLVIGAQSLIYGATEIARLFGVPERIIGITLVALGTSLPELAATIAAARKNNLNLTVGNILGSNVFNALAAGGISASITPLIATGFKLDLTIMLLFSLALAPLFLRQKEGSTKPLGALLLGSYTLYTLYLFIMMKG